MTLHELSVQNQCPSRISPRPNLSTWLVPTENHYSLVGSLCLSWSCVIQLSWVPWGSRQLDKIYRASGFLQLQINFSSINRQFTRLKETGARFSTRLNYPARTLAQILTLASLGTILVVLIRLIKCLTSLNHCFWVRNVYLNLTARGSTLDVRIWRL